LARIACRFSGALRAKLCVSELKAIGELIRAWSYGLARRPSCSIRALPVETNEATPNPALLLTNADHQGSGSRAARALAAERHFVGLHSPLASRQIVRFAIALGFVTVFSVAVANAQSLRVQISGRAVDSMSGEPIAMMSVRVGGVVAKTDSTGRFALDAELPTGSLSMTFSRICYVTATQTIGVSAARALRLYDVLVRHGNCDVRDPQTG
jgi:hypothetical protein